MQISKHVFNDKEYKKVVISRVDTKGKILDASDSSTYKIEDSGESKFIEKVLFTITDYGVTPTVNVQHFLDIDDLEVLCLSISRVDPIKAYVEFKGSVSDKYPTGQESRVLNLAWWPDGNNKSGAYTLEITNGAGEKGASGQVMPAKGQNEPKKVKIILSIPEAMRFFLSIQRYNQSKLTAFLANNYKALYGG